MRVLREMTWSRSQELNQPVMGLRYLTFTLSWEPPWR